ncbi:hypothetical protein [Paraburkholderia sp. BR14320]|uniref:hypothetical protein n=1 Tax=unclassified Paraburkholderia TaxID=2615204 RepID=UPI0034CDB6E5
MSALSANTIATAVTGGQGVTDQGQLAAIVAATTLLGGTAAGLLGQNVQGAVTAAQNETLNNTCAPDHDCGTLKSAIADTGRAAWNTALGVVQSIPNAVNGALPGYPDYVPFLQGAMLPYDDSDFGSLVSLVGAVGAGSLLGGSSTKSAAATEGATNSAGPVTAQNFFDGSQCTSKVLNQAASGDHHGFPQSVDAFSGEGTVSQIVGGDGVTRSMLTIPGTYNGKTGVFEYIRNPDGTINHRLFVPNK